MNRSAISPDAGHLIEATSANRSPDGNGEGLLNGSFWPRAAIQVIRGRMTASDPKRTLADSPDGRSIREELVETLTDSWEDDPFDAATSDFFELESEFHQGLLDYLMDHKDEFANIIEA